MESDFKTPTKVEVKIKLTPSTKQNVCVLCGDKYPKEKKLLVQRGVKSVEYFLIEKLLQIKITENEHSDIVCRSCQRRLATIDNHLSQFQNTYKESRNKLLLSHGHKSTKRLSVENTGSNKRKALFTDQASSSPSLDISRDDQTRYILKDGISIQTKAVDPKYENLLQALMYSKDTEIEQEVLKLPNLVECVKTFIFKSLQEEVRNLCLPKTDSILRHSDKQSLMNFSFANVEEEWKEKAPLFHKFLTSSSVSPLIQSKNNTKTEKKLIHGQVAAGCKILNLYNREMKALQSVNNLILLKGGLKKSAFNRLHATADCQTYKTAIDQTNKIADQWDDDLTIWQEEIRVDNDLEQELTIQLDYIQDTIQLLNSAGMNSNDLILEQASLQKELEELRKKMHPGFYFVGDNVDMRTKVRQMTMSNQNKDQHMYQICAYLHRVDGNDLDNSKPIQDAKQASFSDLIPGRKEREMMLENFAFLTAKRWCKYIQYFTPYDSVLPEFIDHPYIGQTQKKTTRINVGVLKKNESKNEDMADICKFMHKYIPGHDEGSNSVPVKTLSGGDYLTFERHKQAQMSVRDDATPSLRLEGLIPKMEEFHNQAEFLKVFWLNLYSTVSSRDIGTMYAARNLINSRNVTSDPAGNYYASALMADKFTEAYLVAGALAHFDMSLTSEPKQNKYDGEIGNKEEMKGYILGQARHFVERMVDIGITPLPDYGNQSNTMECRYCHELCNGRLRLRKHEHLVHGHRDPKFSPDWITEDESNTADEDMIYNYTKLTLTLGLLRLNHNDAIKMGDGERLMTINQYLFLLYKNKKNNCPKYAFGLLETICQMKILLTPRLAHRLKWNRTVNHRGKKDTNHPNDLDIEHCNKIFKDEAHSYRGVFTDKTVSRVSRSALNTYKIVKNYDKQTGVHEASGVHTDADITNDVEAIVNQLTQSDVFKTIPGRTHNAFPSVKTNPFSTNMEEIRDWISSSLEKFAAKHFYP